MTKEVIFKPWPGAQTEFMNFDGRYALFGGAAGPGKSKCLIYYPFRQIFIEDERKARGEIQSSVGRSIIFRRTMPELRELIDRTMREFPRFSGADWHEQTKTWTFPCGYKYMFGQMEEAKDWIKYYSFEFTFVGFDECTTFEEEQVNQLDMRLRTTDPVLKNLLWLRLATNPVGPGVEWVKKRYVDVAPPRRLVIRRIKVAEKDPETGKERQRVVERQQIYIPARLEDNPSLDAVEYSATLSSHSPEVRRQLLLGDWNVVQGAWVGDLWDPSVHVCKPFKIPNGWFRFRSGDFGTSSKSSIQWWAVDFDGNLVCYRSLTVTKHTSEMLGGLIREIEMEHGEWNVSKNQSLLNGPLDSACWNPTGVNGPSIADAMMAMGVVWSKSDKSAGRHAAADQFRTRLMRRTGHPTQKDPQTGRPALVVPGIRWLEGRAVRSPRKYTFDGPIKSIPVLQADPDDPDVPDTRGDDHDWDSAAYACMFRFIVPEKKDYIRDPLDPDYIDDLEAERMKKRKSIGRMGRAGLW